ncbi:hypothetical protein [uncultured Ruminococcus sp.]|nr:hypothetical protein [uncultured Ruminococcus sp.]
MCISDAADCGAPFTTRPSHVRLTRLKLRIIGIYTPTRRRTELFYYAQ